MNIRNRINADRLYQKIGAVHMADVIVLLDLPTDVKAKTLHLRNFEAKGCKELLNQLGRGYDAFLTETVDDMVEVAA